MVFVTLEEDSVVIELSLLENFGAFHWCCCTCAPYQIPFSAIDQVRVVHNLWQERRGIRVGTGIPGIIALGSWWYFSGQDFCAVYGSHPGIVIELKESVAGSFAFRRFILSLPNHVEVAEEIIRNLN